MHSKVKVKSKNSKIKSYLMKKWEADILNRDLLKTYDYQLRIHCPSSFFFRLFFFLASKACCNRYSICPLVLLNSSPAQVSISFKTSGLIRNIKAFFSAIVNVGPLVSDVLKSLSAPLKISAAGLKQPASCPVQCLQCS
jgi:hypothetical protein